MTKTNTIETILKEFRAFKAKLKFKEFGIENCPGCGIDFEKLEAFLSQVLKTVQEQAFEQGRMDGIMEIVSQMKLNEELRGGENE